MEFSREQVKEEFTAVSAPSGSHMAIPIIQKHFGHLLSFAIFFSSLLGSYNYSIFGTCTLQMSPNSQTLDHEKTLRSLRIYFTNSATLGCDKCHICPHSITANLKRFEKGEDREHGIGSGYHRQSNAGIPRVSPTSSSPLLPVVRERRENKTRVREVWYWCL